MNASAAQQSEKREKFFEESQMSRKRE